MLVEEFCDMDMKNYVVGNYQFIKFKKGCMSPVHIDIQQLIKYESAWCAVSNDHLTEASTLTLWYYIKTECWLEICQGNIWALACYK